MKQFKGRWKTRLEQLELWMVSHRIEVELRYARADRQSCLSRTQAGLPVLLAQTLLHASPLGCKSRALDAQQIRGALLVAAGAA